LSIDVEAFYRQYAPMVLRRCRYMLKDEDSASDLMQDVFVQILKNSHKLNSEAPSSLLYLTATRLCLNRIRDGKKEAVYLSGELLDQWGQDGSFEDKVQSRNFIEQLFKQEKESTRTMAYLHYIDRFTLEETSEMMSLSVSGVRKRLRKLREKSLILREAE